jgi:tetratricopeptide (TPR) repeat protein
MRKFILKIGAILLLAEMVNGCKPSHALNSPNDYFKVHWQDESQFIVETIVSDIAEQIYYAKYKCVPDPKWFFVSATETAGSPFGAPVYELEIDLDKAHQGFKTKLNVNGPIWSPGIYDDLTKQLAQNLGLNGAGKGESDTAMLASLADGKAATIEEENQKLSQALQSNFTDPTLHEQAAALLGAFTLREHTGDFYEIRSPLCRITAHLAMAQYFNEGNPFGINGQIANVMLLTLMNDETAALKGIDGIMTNDTALIGWTRALRAVNTGDYRQLDKLDGLTEIECIAWFHALRQSANSDIAWSKLSETQKRIPDFVRIASEGNYSVGLGHELLALSLPLEFDEIANVFELSHDKKLTQKELVPVLNQMPDRCFSAGVDGKIGVHVIGWGLWAAFFQRQLCHAVQHNFNFMQRQWGVPDEAKSFSAKCDPMLSGLRLYPFVRRFNCTDVASYHKSVDDGFKVTVAVPQLVPAECWNYLCYRFEGNEYNPNPNPHVNEWHKHNPPPGTAYNPLPRLNHPSLVDHADAVDKLHEIAPYDRDIAWYIWKTKYHKTPTYEEAMALFQPLVDYDDYAMERVAEAQLDNPVRYEKLLSKAAEINPSDYFKLADYFETRDADKAAAYIEKGNSLDPDSVGASYYASWLIKYYLKNSRTNDASREADFGGEVYSSVGLQAKAEFLEATGDYTGAFQWFSNIEERYDESGPLLAFCLRYKAKTGDTRYDDEARKRMSKFFPKGIEKVSLTDFHSPPKDGVLIREATDLARAAGLKVGDVIVAVYGIRVHNFAQYDYGRDTIADPELDLIVWQGDGYHEIKARPPNHRFGGDFGDYVPR